MLRDRKTKGYIGYNRSLSYNKSDSTYIYWVLALSLLYGGLLASLPLYAFLDRINYLNYAKYSWNILRHYWARGPLVYLVNEPLWLLINTGLSKVFSPDNVLIIIIFVPASLVAWNILKQDKRQFIWLLFFLVLPQVIKNHIIHLRQGVAIAVFITGWFCDRRLIKWLLIISSPLIHASFFFVLGLLLMAKLASKIKLEADLRTLMFAMFAIVIGFTLGWMAYVFGARQAYTYSFTMTDVSGLGFFFWVTILVVMCSEGLKFVQRYAFEIGTIIFYLGTYFLIEVTARIFESSLLLVLLAGLRLTGWRRAMFLFLIVSYGILQYAMRINKPWLGFGV